MKPTRGRLVAMEGSALMPVKIVHQGVVSRSVRDTAAFYHAAEQHYRNRSLPEIGLVTQPGRRLRIGFFTHADDNTPSHPDCVAATVHAAKLLEGLGHEVEEVARPFDDRFLEDFFMLWSSLGFALSRFGRRLVHPDFDSGELEEFTLGLADHFSQNKLKAIVAISRLRRFGRRYARAFDRFDVLMSPTVAMPPPEHGYIGPDVPFEETLDRLKWFIPFTPAENVSGAPAISLPLGRSEDGLPLGVQFAAAFGDERTLLELSLEVEEAVRWQSLSSGST